MSLDQEVELVRRLSIFRKMDLAMLKLLCFSSERLRFEAGQVMFKEGEVGDAAYVLIAGQVDVSVAGPSGPIVVRTLGPNELVGEIAIFDDIPRTATVTATASVEALRIAKEQFISVIRGNPDAALELIRILASRLANTTAQLTRSRVNKPT
ncbi:MAG: cyclic nucleotide-binding domain-containing protein [Burkholderiaceae bacterium]